jgi:CRP/FNR family transcriptional regulator, cyclic AMP receptor protein
VKESGRTDSDLIEEGSVIITTRMPTYSQIVIQTLGTGDAVGWAWLFEPYTWHFDARAAETTSYRVEAIPP